METKAGNPFIFDAGKALEAVKEMTVKAGNAIKDPNATATLFLIPTLEYLEANLRALFALRAAGLKVKEIISLPPGAGEWFRCPYYENEKGFRYSSAESIEAYSRAKR